MNRARAERLKKAPVARASGPHARRLRKPPGLAFLLCLLVSLFAAGDAGAIAQSGEDLPDELLPRAQVLIRDHNTTYGSTPHFKVYSDDPRIDTKRAATLLEYFQEQFEADWKAFPGRREAEGPAHVFLFYSRLKYGKLSGIRETGSITAPGHYNVLADIVAIHTDTVHPGDLGDLLVHEAAHQLTQTTLLGPDVRISFWLMEGLAEYYGNMLRDPKTGFQPLRFGDKNVEMFHEGSNKSRGLRVDDLRQYKREMSKGVATPVDVLVTDAPTSTPDGKLQRYTASWMLVHFLMQGEGGRHREGFGRYLAMEAAGRRGPAVLHEALGMDSAALQTAFEAHVKQM